jgi:transcriptional regulator with XRE-family HTH domain
MKCPYCEGTGVLGEATFGAIVLQARKTAGLTQHELAAKAAISRAQLANIETDRTDVPLKTASRIAEGLGVPLKDLMP